MISVKTVRTKVKTDFEKSKRKQQTQNLLSVSFFAAHWFDNVPYNRAFAHADSARAKVFLGFVNQKPSLSYAGIFHVLPHYRLSVVDSVGT